MTTEDRQILLAVCEQMKEVLDCQLQQDSALRSLGKALLKHLPTLKEDYQEAQQILCSQAYQGTQSRKLAKQLTK